MDSSGLKEDIFYSSSWMQEILEISNIGLWLLEKQRITSCRWFFVLRAMYSIRLHT